MPKQYIVFDASALAFKYIRFGDTESERIRARLARLFAQRAANPAAIIFQVPSICMAECSKAFAKACFERNIYGIGSDAKRAYSELRDALLKDVSQDRVIHSYEVRRAHYVQIESIFERDYCVLPKPNLKKKGRRLSPNDALILSMAQEIAQEHASGVENVHIITAEIRLAQMCRKFPDEYPRVKNIRDDEVTFQL